MMALTRVTPPGVLPVSVAEAKKHLRIDHEDDDAQIETFTEAATAHLDGWRGVLGRALISQTWRLDVAGWCNPLQLPLGPVLSVAEVAYSDSANADQVLAAGYSLHGDALYLDSGATWPGVYSRPDAIRVKFTAGFGAQPEDVPAPIRVAILMLVAHFYADREPIGTKFEELPFGPRVLLAPYRRLHI